MLWKPILFVLGMVAFAGAIVVGGAAITEEKCGVVKEIGTCTSGSWASSGRCRVLFESGDRTAVRNPTMVGDTICWRE